MTRVSAGTLLGPYRIDSKLGEGGMGEVYRARDTRLKRDVAVKVLPPSFVHDADRRARFRREAEILATLNHPHIAAVYGLEEAGDVMALVLELVEGPTLADRLAEGPVPIPEALRIARQIAEALEAAHDTGIIHRDLKPANIKLRPDGTVKILDFGLAKSLEPAGVSSLLTQVSIETAPAPTLSGMILGTPTYMSPEQARGQAVDTRTDIWAFGCVLYELLTARRPFPGDTVTDVVAAIISREPDWQALPPDTPARIRSLLVRCLRKEPAQRLRDIADGRFQIEEVLNDPGPSTPVLMPPHRYREWAAWIAAAVLLGTTLFLVTRPSTPPVSRDAISFPVFPPDNAAFSAAPNTTVDVPSFALAPDGRALVFSAETTGGRPMLWLRSLDRLDARPLAGTEDAQSPFWSPDSRSVGFFADGALKSVPAAGGTVQIIKQTIESFRGASWGSRNTILLATGVAGIGSLDAAGGTITPVTVVDASLQENSHRNPSFLPDGLHFLYSAIGNGDRNGVYIGSVDGKTKQLLISNLTSAVYAPPGYVLFVDKDTLRAQAFDADRLELKGQPFFVAEHVGRNTSFLSAVSASLNGTIAYARLLSQNGHLSWIDRHGNPVGSPITPEGDYVDFRLSPDETRLAGSLADPRANVVDIWITDLARGGSTPIRSGGGVTAAAIWSPDGTRLAFRSNRTGVIDMYERSAAGGGGDRPVLPPDYSRAPGLIPTDWSPNGRHLLGGSGNDLLLIPLATGGKPEKLIASPGAKMHGNFSPDGRLVAYTSNESGKFEVYVETVPQSDRKWPVSTNGGYEPRWRADGREIYYLSDDRTLMAVPVEPGPHFGPPTPLFQTHVPTGVTGLRTHYVPSRDGQRFLVNVATDAAASPITVVLNWTALLSK